MASSLMLSRRGRSVDDCSPFRHTDVQPSCPVREIRAKLTRRYKDGTWRLFGERTERRESAGHQGILQWGEHGLECDDDMGNAGHRVRGLSVDSEVVVLPKDIRLIWPGGRIERWRVYLGVECSVDDPAHGTSWLWSEGHEGAKARSETSRGRPGHPPIRPFIACLSYHFPSSSSPLPLASP